MRLQTKIPYQESGPQIGYNSNVLLLGSCFAENIGKKLEHYKFKHLINPFGILFQPRAIEKILERTVGNKAFSEADVFYHNERWHSFDAHSALSNTDKDQLLINLNKGLLNTQNQLREASHIILTLGTAWAYRYLKTDHLVANCHKVPQKEFSKELLSVNSLEESLENSINAIRSVNQEALILFTISPVRHLKDGFVENQHSKAHLFTALHANLISEGLAYFPAYEIMMDELRDYRFYNEDMLHPNQLAINYIWEHFMKCWIRPDTVKEMEKVTEVQKGLQHIPFNPDAEQHQKFVAALEQKIVYLQNAHPHMRF